uniref:Extracellular matrix protein 1 n=2 Tax=Varanus komodoensis TaxID=61221 RepID=A0A8D2IK54_VARKO
MPPLPNLEEFPPARPTAGNIGKICAAGRRKLSYGPWNLPQTSYSHLARQGAALNSLEEGVQQCCQRPEDEKVPCCSGVWLAVLEQFCKAEYATKTRPYHCCKQSGAGRERCFADEAPFPEYDFAKKKSRGCPDPSRCGAALSFPPGEPSGANIRNLCKLRRFRPTYPASSLPKSYFGWFVRQARAVNRMESAFKKCCRPEDAGCAHQAWERVLVQYCRQEFSVKDRRHYCCNKETGEPDYRCFASDAPYPLYDKEIRVLSLAEVTPELLDSLCGQFTLLTKQKNIPALIQNITEPCCPLQGQERTQCAEDAKSEFIATICGPQRNTWKDPKRCCSQTEDKARGGCFNRNYLAQVPVASPAPTVRPTEPAS